MRYFVFKEFNWLNAHLFLKSLDFVPRAGLKNTFSINCCHHHVSIKSKFCAPLCVKVTKICWKIFLGYCLLLLPWPFTGVKRCSASLKYSTWSIPVHNMIEIIKGKIRKITGFRPTHFPKFRNISLRKPSTSRSLRNILIL